MGGKFKPGHRNADRFFKKFSKHRARPSRPVEGHSSFSDNEKKGQQNGFRFSRVIA